MSEKIWTDLSQLERNALLVFMRRFAVNRKYTIWYKSKVEAEIASFTNQPNEPQEVLQTVYYVLREGSLLDVDADPDCLFQTANEMGMILSDLDIYQFQVKVWVPNPVVFNFEEQP